MDIGHYLARTARRVPRRTALIDGRRSLRYRELDERVSRLANALLGLGLRPGDRVLDLQHNALEYVETDVAMARAGLVRVAVNSRLTPADWAYIAGDCGARGLVAGEGFGDLGAALLEEADSIEYCVSAGGGPGLDYEAVLAGGSAVGPVHRPGLDELVSLNYSSGTTGQPKGCMRTHGNRFASARDILVDLMERPLGTEDVWLHAGPLTHASGLFVLPHVIAGATQVLMARFDPDEALALVAEHRVTGTVWVPTMVERVLACGNLQRADLASLQRVAYAGAPMAPDRIREASAHLGGRLVQFYGMVEAIPPLSVLSQADHTAAVASEGLDRLGSAGRAVLGCELEVLDDDGHPVPPGEVGELVVAGDHVMRGYWGRDDETGKTLRDGKLWTGDLARMDATGYVTIIDRRSDMIISGGYNVYPREVEDAIAELAAVREVAVIGTPDREWGQIVTAFVVPDRSGGVTAEAVADHCAARLPGFKKPRRIEFVDALPKGSTGKIARKELRQQAYAGSRRLV